MDRSLQRGGELVVWAARKASHYTTCCQPAAQQCRCSIGLLHAGIVSNEWHHAHRQAHVLGHYSPSLD